MKNRNTFQDQVLEPFLLSVKEYADSNSFCINNTFYTYKRLGEIVSAIRDAVSELAPDNINIGLIANDDIETYGAIIALWLEGKCYIPVNPESPRERNTNIIKQAELSVIIDSSERPIFTDYILIRSNKLAFKGFNLVAKDVPDEALAYIFFTSGTTGIPKGVPITRSNLAGFVRAFFALEIEMGAADKCLQMFDLTFDLSVMSYLTPLLKGACVYTIPKNRIKFNYIAELLDEHHLTIALMVPSIIHSLRQYFVEIDCKSMKYSLFCGEALPLDVTKEWSNCVPNAKIMNVYGPTEDTIFCTHYTYDRIEDNKALNGLLSIGKAMKDTYTIIINENNEIVKPGEKGELCLGGVQLTPGYWKNEEKNRETFFYTVYNGESTRFYKTGDLCLADADGDIMYSGRIDYQIKVQGFRVELSEIEFVAKKYLQKTNAVAIAVTNKMGSLEIGMVIESGDFDTKELISYMKTKIPIYMIPKQIYFMGLFPLNSNGKTDRNKLGLLFKNTLV